MKKNGFMKRSAISVSEIFTTNQGEGKYVGARNLFVRFNNCNIKCSYCDTKDDINSQYLYYEAVTFSRRYKKFRNPVSYDKIFLLIERLLKKNSYECISFTGGEPLLNSDFLLPAMKKIKSGYYNDIRLLIETNGTLYDEMKKIRGLTDIVSMDIKLPSSSQNRPLWQEHKKFLKVISGLEIYIKLVVDNRTNLKEIIRTAAMLKKYSRKKNLIVFIQPVNYNNEFKFFNDMKKMIKWQNIFLKEGVTARILPQIHKLIGEK